MEIRRRRQTIGVLAALGAAAALLALPSPDRAGGPPAGAGRTTLAEIWPAARVVGFARIRPDGTSYEPRMVLDADRSIGLLTGADGSTVSLALFSQAAPERPRLLHTVATADQVVFDAVTASAGAAYWMTTAPDEHGLARATLWGADLAGGPTRRLTTDTGRPVFLSSQYDLQIAEGRVHWVSSPEINATATELRSVPTGGGRVEVLPLDGAYVRTAWPWLTSDPGPVGAQATLVNTVTGQRTTVPVGATDQVRCSPAWCRISTPGADGDTITMLRPDGTGRRRIDRDGETGTVDVAIADRFELLTTPMPTERNSISETLALYDLRTGRAVLIAVVSSRSARDGWLWWETTDGETQTWHLLDLTGLS